MKEASVLKKDLRTKLCVDAHPHLPSVFLWLHCIVLHIKRVLYARNNQSKMGASKSTSRHHEHAQPVKSIGVTIMGSNSSTSSWMPIVIFLLVVLCGEGNSGSQITFIVGAGDMSPPASASALTASSSSSGNAGGGGGGSSNNNNNHGNGHQAMMMVMPAASNGKAAIESLGNVTVLAGQRGELKCRVANLANNTVSIFQKKI